MKRKKIHKPIFQLFTHLEGIVVIPTILSLSKNGIIKKILKTGQVCLNDFLKNEKNIQSGYLNVALTTLASLGILEKSINKNDSTYRLTPYGKDYLKLIDYYNIFNELNTNLYNFINNDISSYGLYNHIDLVNNYLHKDSSTLSSLYKKK